MAGATAATAAGVTTSQAGLVTITLSNNYISATGGNHLNADLTGDGLHRDGDIHHDARHDDGNDGEPSIELRVADFQPGLIAFAIGVDRSLLLRL